LTLLTDTAAGGSDGRYWFAIRPQGVAHGFPVLVFDAAGRVDLALTLFAKEAGRRKAEATARTYLYAVLPFFTFLAHDPWQLRASRTWDGPPSVVRQAVEDYLVDRLGCRVDEHRLGFRVVTRSGSTPSTIPIFLSGLKLFYRVMRSVGLYGDAHPLVDAVTSTAADLLDRLRVEAGVAPPMPAISGVGASDAAPNHRLSDSYFRLRGSEWIPQVVDDPSLPRRVLTGGRTLRNWGLRETCVVRLLFETGARISEVVGLTLGDWVDRGRGVTVRAFSKGSRGRRVKTLRFRPGTAKLLRRYINGERRRCDLRLRSLSDYVRVGEQGEVDLHDVPLFLTRRGDPLTVKQFRRGYWKPACAAAGIDADPHQARHWFVTACVREIYAVSDRDGEVQRGKEALMDYMAWRSGEQTLRAYEHVVQTDLAAMIQDRVHAHRSGALTRELGVLEGVAGEQAAPHSSIHELAAWEPRPDEQRELALLEQLLQ
jgi:hypothetical protein